MALYNYKGFDLGQPECSSGFSHFLKFKSEFGNKEFMIWAMVWAPGLVFADCIELLHLWQQRI